MIPSEVKEANISLHIRHPHQAASELAQCQNSPPLPDSWRESKTLSTSKKNHHQGAETAFRPLSLFFTQLAKMALQAFPTKQEFLAFELEPVERPECPICQEIMVEPVRLPCQGKHEFCKACITRWFKGQGNRTCPNCRQALCRPKHSVTTAAPPESARADFREEEVEHGFQHGDLARFLPWGHHVLREPGGMDTFHDQIRWSEAHFQQMGMPAHSLLSGETFHTQVEGALLIDGIAMGSCLVLLGNVIRRKKRYPTSITEYTGKKRKLWTQATWDLWPKMLLTIWQLLSPHDGIRLDSRAMFHAIMASLLDQTVYGKGGDVQCPFFTDHTHLEDLTHLVYFLLTHAGTRMSKLTVQTEFEARRIIEPRTLPRTASALAIRHAERLTAQAFPASE
jgi:hypothetical protein